MKVFVPRNIEKGLFNMHFQLWPITVSLVQLVLIAVWSAMTLAIRNAIVKSGWNKVIATLMAAPIMLVFLFVAFFKISELSLLPYLAKMRRNRFLDTTKKFQTNDTKIDPLHIIIAESHSLYEDTEQKDQKKHTAEDIPSGHLSSDDLLS
jgi:hypothetical protein